MLDKLLGYGTSAAIALVIFSLAPSRADWSDSFAVIPKATGTTAGVKTPLSLTSLEPKIVQREAELAVGMGASYSLEGSKEIVHLWERFKPRIQEVPSAKGTHTLGISCAGLSEISRRPGDAYVYVAAVPVTRAEALPDAMVKVELPAGRYAVFTHKGPLANLSSSMDYIWGSWLKRTREKYRNAPSFELYDQRFKSESPESEVDIYIPVE